MPRRPARRGFAPARAAEIDVSLTGAAFLLAFAAGLGLALFRHPLFGLYTYLAVFYLHPPSRWWGETLPDLRWALLAAAVTLVASWRLPAVPGRTPWHKTTPARAMILFTIWFWIQNLWALEPQAHLEASFLFTKYVLLFFLTYRLAVTPTDMWRLLFVHLGGCAYLGWLAFNSDFSGRLEGVGGPGIDEANAFAMQMATGAVVGAMVALSISGIARWWAIACLPFILNSIILSGSRGGFLALLAAGLVLWQFKPQEHRKLFYAFAAMGVVLFGVLAHDMFWERMGTMETAVVASDEEMDTSAESRFALAHAQVRMAARYPHGTGHRGTATLSPLYLDERFLSASVDGEDRRRSSHNTFLSAWVEQGIPGAVFYIWIWGWAALTARRLKADPAIAEDPQRRALLAATAAALVVVLVAGIFVDYIKTEVQVWMWAVLASIAALSEKDRVVAATDGNPIRQPRTPARRSAVTARELTRG